MIEAKSYWELANYIVAFNVVQALAFSYILSEARPGMCRLVRRWPRFLPWLIAASFTVFLFLIVGCWLAEYNLLEIADAKPAISRASFLAFIGRLIIVFTTAIGLYALVKKVRNLIVVERESFAYSSECV